MSTTRAAIATAAAAVDGITAHAYATNSTAPGTVYPRLERITYPNPFGGVAFWNVVLILPQDIAQSEKYLERVGPQLKEALAGVLVVTEIQLVRLDLPGVGILPAAFINGHREEDTPS